MDEMTMGLEGLKETQAYMERLVGDLKGPPVLRTMSESTLKLERAVKLNMRRDWFDTGRSMSSVTPDIKLRDRTLMGVVGSNVTYVPFGEFGTGIYAEPDATFGGSFAIHKARTGRRGGIRPRRMFGKALEASKSFIENLWDRAVTMMVERR